jgi:hypothetical protein
MFMVDIPAKGRTTQTEVVKYLSGMSKQYRVFPMDGTDPMYFVSNKIPVVFTSNAVQQRRWQEFLDNMAINSVLPDLINTKYLVLGADQYAKDKENIDPRYRQVFVASDTKQVILENSSVLPKAWLVDTTYVNDNGGQILQMMQSPLFDPRKSAFVESAPPLPLASSGNAGTAEVKLFEGEKMEISANASTNSLLVLGEKYYKGWTATVDGKPATVYPVNYILRGVYLPPGQHRVTFVFDPLPFKIGKYLTFASFALFAVMLARELRRSRSEAVPA